MRLFGPQAQLADAACVAVTVPAAATVRDVRQAMEVDCEALRPSLASSRLAIDFSYAADDDLIPDGAEVALIGLVSGG